MTVLLYTYTDWQGRVVPLLEAALKSRGKELLWIGRRSPGINSTIIRGVPPGNPFKSLGEFEAEGPLPTLCDPIAFEKAFLSSYVYQMNRYKKGYGSRGHKMKYYHEYRDHFFLTARKFKRLLIKKQVTSLIFINMPHTGDDYLLYRVAEDMGLRITMFMVSPFKNRFFSTSSIEHYGITNTNCKSDRTAPIQLEALKRQVSATIKSYMLGVHNSNSWNLSDIFFAITSLLRLNPRLLLDIKFLPKNLIELARLRRSLNTSRRTRRELLSGHRTTELLNWLTSLRRGTTNLPEKFVYFPLHFQPELTTVPQGGVFGDQALAIEMLRAALPTDVAIVVKENPKQGAFHRENTFTSRLKQLENVMLLHPSFSTEILEQSCLAVSVVTGTAGWEAIRDGRPCICFGHAWYLDCPGVHKFTRDLDLQGVLDNPPVQATSEAFLNDLISRSHEGVVYEFFQDNDDPDVEEKNFSALTELMVQCAFGEKQLTFDASGEQ